MNDLSNIKVPWSGRGHLYTEEEIRLVAEVMQNADPLTQGKYQNEFESKFSEKMKSAKSFAVATATAALELSAILCDLKAGDEVIIPAHTFAATAIPFGRTGAKIVWADIDPHTWLVTRETIEPLITSKTKVLVVVHLYGLIVEMDSILELAKEKGILVVEDAAQALGAEYKGKKAGTLGDFACFSFHSHKNITTLGEGGMLVVKSPEHQKWVPGLRHNGTAAFSADREFYWKPAMSNVDFGRNGIWPYNFCLGEVQCALGAKLLDRIDAVTSFRRLRHEKVRNALSDFPELSLQQIKEPTQSAYHLLPAKYDGKKIGKTRDNSISRDDLIKLLTFEFGIKTVVQYYPLYRYPLFQKAGFGTANCPNTDDYFDSMISIPFQDFLTEDQIDYTIESVRKSLKILRG